MGKVDISKLSAIRVKSGHYRVCHGSTVYDIKKTPGKVWCLTKNGEYIADFSTKAKATFYAWWFLLEAQKKISKRRSDGQNAQNPA